MERKTLTDIAPAKLTSHSPKDRAFFGHPRGLGYIALTEGGITFSYYGMQSILALYLVGQLLTPGHMEKIWGFAQFRGALEAMYGPIAGGQPLAAAIVGLFGAFVYATPIVTGLIADRLLGRKAVVMIGAILLTLGHVLMAFDYSFVIALLCLITGMGCVGNLKAQVGGLYDPDDLRRSDAFQIFLLAVQLSVIVSPIVCGFLGEKIAWHWGFAAAGAGMALGLLVYVAATPWLPPDPVRKDAQGHTVRPKMTTRQWQVVAVLALLIPVFTLSSMGNNELFNAYPIWGKDNYQLTFFGKEMPVSWLLSLDALVSTVTILASVVFWRWYGSKWKEPDEIVKCMIGAAIAATGPLILAFASLHAAGGHKIGLGWGLAFHIMNDLGFANIYPVGMALFSRAAPPALGATVVNAFSLHVFLSNLILGKVAGLLSTMSGFNFWGMHALMVAAASVLFLVFFLLFRRLLAPTGPALDEPVPPNPLEAGPQ